MNTTYFLARQDCRYIQTRSAGEDTDPAPTSDVAIPRDGTSVRADHPTRQSKSDSQGAFAGGGTNSATTNDRSAPKLKASSPPTVPDDHHAADAQGGPVVGDYSSTSPAIVVATANESSPVLVEPTLALLADVLDDLERTRIANENRLRALTRSEADSDGEVRGFGLDESHPDVARLAGVVDGIAKLEHEATLNLQRALRRSPLGPWVKAQKGVGEKQAARLLAALGDPYIRPVIEREDGTVEPARPRTVSELWAYCGLHTLPASHGGIDAQSMTAGGINVAARRKRGEKANWSADAKMRAWNIAGAMLKAGNREVYDKRKAATEGRLHAAECVRCGPSGKPAQPGSPWSDGHRHADALRIVSKELLKQLWREGKRLHEQAAGHVTIDTQPCHAAGPDLGDSQRGARTQRRTAVADST